MANGISNKYYTSNDLGDYRNDPRTGLPLAGGYMSCYVDDQRGTSKPVYQLSGNPPVYTYERLPDPVPFSPNGMPMNASGDIVKVYYYPYDEDGNLQLYYLEIFASDGYLCYEIPAMPNLVESSTPESVGNGGYENQLSNPQFVEVDFDDEAGYELNLTGSGSNEEYQIAPKWFIRVSWNGTSNIIINRVAMQGSLNIPTNPPYVLQVQSSGSISLLQLVQRLDHDPDIWSTTTAAPGYVAGTMLASSLNGFPVTLSMYYSPSVAPAPQIIATGSTGVSGYQLISGTVELAAGANSDNGDTGYVDIYTELPVNGNIYISSLQVVGLYEDVSVAYSQETTARQIDHLFNYYKPVLEYKPIPSYLTGWDFPLNPSQFSITGTPANGSNTSSYIWDQTILFLQNSGAITFDRDGVFGGLKLTASADTQFALIQYLPRHQANSVLSGNVCSNILAFSDNPDGLKCTVSLWYTTGSVPDLKDPNYKSIVGTLDSNGKPQTFNGTWVEVPSLSGSDETVVIGAQNSDDFRFNDYPLGPWGDATGDAEGAANYFAIVVGFETLTSGSLIDLASISLVPGEIATRPAPIAYADAIVQCQNYYDKSYDIGTMPGTPTSIGQRLAGMTDYHDTLTATTYVYFKNFEVNFNQRQSPKGNLTLYSPSTGASGFARGYLQEGSTIHDLGEYAPTASIALGETSATYIYAGGPAVGALTETSVSPSAQGYLLYHYVRDARLGVNVGV